MRFLGLKDRTASTLSYVSQSMYWIKINAYRNAKLHEPPTSNRRWPITFFSHGLAGSRNAYSYICGDMASYGMIVVAMDHRDGSSPIQYVRATKDTEARLVDQIKISHEQKKEVFEARDRQLRIRLWEISMAYEALSKIDAGQKIENLDENTSHKRKERVEVLQQFSGKLDINRPGKVSWCGHSFGASTITQLLKSVYYSKERPFNAGRPLLSPNSKASICRQITPMSPTILLDMWGLPLQSPDQTFLWNKPLPSYAESGPNGENVLSVLSEGFHNWKNNLNIIKHIVARPAQYRLDDTESQDSGYESHGSRSPSQVLAHEGSSSTSSPRGDSRKRPSRKPRGAHMFFVEQSQHFNHSDYGVLFPWITKRFAKAEEPEYILALNTRAAVEVIRQAGVEVSGKADNEILNSKSSINRWTAIPLDDADETAALEAIDSVKRTLSNTSSNEVAPPEEQMTMS